MEVAGANGCRKGWLVVRAEVGDRLRLRAVTIEPGFKELLVGTRHCRVVAVDIPIGLSDGPDPRPPDVAARRLLGTRRSSVFPAPIRPVLKARSYKEACDISYRVSGKKISKQVYNGLLGRVREVDQAMTPELQQRIFEVHPEVSFWKLNAERPMDHSKKKAAGRQERLRLLSRVFQHDLASVTVPKGAARDDLYDACAAAWTAARYARGEAKPVPPLDARGLRMEIVY